MRNLMSDQQSCSGLVQKYIGSAYDNVRLVAEHMDAILKMNAALEEGDLEKIADALDDLQRLLGHLDDFENTYQGPKPTAPTLRPDGTQLVDGDLYYDTTLGGLYVYQHGGWNAVGANHNTVEVFNVTAKDLKGNGVTFKLQSSYQPGNNQILVFVNATYQYAITLQTPNGAYNEINSHEINFPDGVLEEGDVVTVLKGDVVTSIDHVVAVNVEAYQTVMPNEKQITLPGGMTYIPGVNNLEVYVEGRLQLVGIDYVETDGGTVTFTRPLPQGTLVTFKSGNIIGANYTEQLNGAIVQALNVAAEFKVRTASLRTDGLVVLLGYQNPNDGGGGIFIYDAAKPRNQANGGSVIDSTMALDQQGVGTGLGCWVRLYANEIKPQWWGVDLPLAKDLTVIGAGQPGDVVQLYGYHEEGDYGEGTFYWDPAQPTRNHDGGVVIDPTQPFPDTWNNATQMRNWFSAKPVGQGCWVRLNRNMANIGWYGARTDGSDNSLILEGITRTVNTGVIDEMRIPEGEYVFNTSYGLHLSNMQGSFRLYGEGKASKLIFQTGAIPMPFVFSDSAGILIEDINITDERQFGQNVAFNVENCSDVRIRNCFISGFAASALRVTENKTLNTTDPCNDIVFANNVVKNCGTDNSATVLIQPKSTSKVLQIHDNIFEACGSTNFGVVTVSAMQEAVVHNNNFVSNAGISVITEGYEDTEIFSNLFQDFGEHAIKVDASNINGYLNPGLAYCKVFNNVISNPGINSTYGILIEGQLNNTGNNNGPIDVTLNTVTNCGGVRVSPQANLPHINILDNKFIGMDDSLFGVLLDDVNGATAKNALIQRNYFEDLTNVRTLALARIAQCDELIFRDNILEKGGQADIEIVNCDKAVITNNIFLNGNIANTPGHGCIDITDNTTHSYIIRENQIIAGGYGNPKSLFAITSNAPTMIVSGNLIGNVPITLSNANFVADASDTALQMGNARHFYSPAVPAAGDYKVGDIVWNTQPAAGGNIGWVCTVAGTPGTWNTFGSIV